MQEAIQQLKAYPDQLHASMLRAVNSSLILLEGDARENSPVGVSGQMRDRWAHKSEVSAPGAIIGRVGSSLQRPFPYPVVIEFGRQPGSMPPPAALKRWVHLKLGVPKEEEASVAFLVARAIAKRGTKPQQPLFRSWQKNEAQINQLFVTAFNELIKRLGKKGT
jgi:hypothetical protein